MFTAKLREAFLFQVPNSFGIFLITFAILKNPFANPLKKVANGIVQNMDWTGQLDWTIGLDSWTGQLDWTVGLDYWTGILFY